MSDNDIPNEVVVEPEKHNVFEQNSIKVPPLRGDDISVLADRADIPKGGTYVPGEPSAKQVVDEAIKDLGDALEEMQELPQPAQEMNDVAARIRQTAATHGVTPEALKEAAEGFRNISKFFMRAFLSLEQACEESAQACVSMAELLESVIEDVNTDTNEGA